MKKSLFALAVLGAFSGVASAQTSVTVYGIADVGISRTDFDNTQANWTVDSGIQSGSRLGFRGTEDLGGGLSAIFTLENGFNIDTGATGQGGATYTSAAANRIFGRQAWVGLNSSALGAIKIGRQYTPMHLALDSIDPFQTGLSGNIEGQIGAVTLFNPYGIRMDNTVSYSTPNFSGFSGQVVYGFGEAAGAFADNRQIGASVGYANGPINAVVAYHNAKPRAAFGAASGAGDYEGAFVGGTYDFGVAKAHLGFQSDKADTVAGADLRDRRNYMVGASAPIGPGSVLASWVRSDDRLATNGDVDQLAIGYTHNLSKRTNLYTSYGHINDRSAVDNDGNQFNVGVRHKF